MQAICPVHYIIHDLITLVLFTEEGKSRSF